MSLLFNMLSGLVIAFLSRRKQLLISWLQSPSAVNLEPPKIKPVTISIVSPSIFMKWWGWMPWSSSFECWALSQLFHFHQVLLYFLPKRWCHLHIWGYWYFSWQPWFQLVLPPTWHLTLTKHDPLEKGMTNQLSILALRTPWTIWKGKKIWHERWTPQVGRCPICSWRRVKK